MATILYAWELGGGLGHLSRFRPIAHALMARGHRIVIASNTLSSAEMVFGADEVRYVQAPLSNIAAGIGPKPPMNYTEILVTCGYLNVPSLTAFVRGWRELFELLAPDLLIADHSPSALLAAHTVGLCRAVIGTGFCSPPRVSPLPHLRPWITLPPRRFAMGERNTVASMNQVIERFGGETLSQVADLFRYAREDFLLTFKEFDHYRWRRDAEYWGPLVSEGQGAVPSWPGGDGPKVFAYLKPGHPHFLPILKQLRDTGARLLVYAGALRPRVLKEFESPRIAFSAQPLDILRVAAECDAAVCHGGHGTVAAMMLAGKPLVTLSMQLEQRILGSRIEDLGAGIMFKPGEGKQGVDRALTRVLEEPSHRERADLFRRDHAGWENAAIIERICARCDELVGVPEDDARRRRAGG